MQTSSYSCVGLEAIMGNGGRAPLILNVSNGKRLSSPPYALNKRDHITPVTES